MLWLKGKNCQVFPLTHIHFILCPLFYLEDDLQKKILTAKGSIIEMKLFCSVFLYSTFFFYQTSNQGYDISMPPKYQFQIAFRLKAEKALKQ